MKKANRDLSLILCLVFGFLLTDCVGSQVEENAGEYTDDTFITTEVKNKILADQDLKGFIIEIQTLRGVVQLRGLVDTKKQALRAQEIAQSVEGVKKVKSSLIVKEIY
ncbi:MAG TPA: BON domain-containing protein [Thermodesulfobacteriota bacterium]|nr:BON domain-containing protein [Thermodesulfobacteriota bacterium]